MRNILMFLTSWYRSLEKYPVIFVRFETEELLEKTPAFSRAVSLISVAPVGRTMGRRRITFDTPVCAGLGEVVLEMLVNPGTAASTRMY